MVSDQLLKYERRIYDENNKVVDLQQRVKKLDQDVFSERGRRQIEINNLDGEQCSGAEAEEE